MVSILAKINDTYNAVKDDIRVSISKLISKGYIINPKFTEKNCKENQIASRNSSGILSKVTYVRLFLEEYSRGNYLFLLNDRSMIQCNYQFITERGERKVSKANLVYLPNPNGKAEELAETIDDLDDEIDVIEELYSESLENEFINDFSYSSNYLRLDYTFSEKDYTEFLHSRCHLHVGMNNNFRIPVSKVPLFSDFLDLVLFLNYPEQWKEYVLDGKEYSKEEFKSIMSKRKKGEHTLSYHNEVLSEFEKQSYHVYM